MRWINYTDPVTHITVIFSLIYSLIAKAKTIHPIRVLFSILNIESTILEKYLDHNLPILRAISSPWQILAYNSCSIWTRLLFGRLNISSSILIISLSVYRQQVKWNVEQKIYMCYENSGLWCKTNAERKSLKQLINIKFWKRNKVDMVIFFILM